MKLNMKKTLIACSLAFTASFSAFAENNITFTAKVIDTACTITVNDGNSTLDLGSASAAELAQKGQTSAPQAFDITLSTCPAAGTGVPTKAYVKFSGITDGDDTYFKNNLTENAATNVAVLIKDGTGNTIINNDSNNAITLPVIGGDIDLHYTASLISTAATPTKGDVSTTVTYTVSYE